MMWEWQCWENSLEVDMYPQPGHGENCASHSVFGWSMGLKGAPG